MQMQNPGLHLNQRETFYLKNSQLVNFESGYFTHAHTHTPLEGKQMCQSVKSCSILVKDKWVLILLFLQHSVGLMFCKLKK